MTEELMAPSPEFLQFLLSEQLGGFTPFERAVDGLSGEDAVRRPPGSPYSVAEVVAHIVFWQERLLGMIDGKEPVEVLHAADGWPSVAADEWQSWAERLVTCLGRYRALASDGGDLRRPLAPGRARSVGAALASHFVHDAHHLGQVILIRRMIGAWPPPGGGDTW